MTTDERIASIRNGQYPCGCQAVGAVAFLLTELDAARAREQRMREELAEIGAALNDPADNVTATTAQCITRMRAREAKLREAAQGVCDATHADGSAEIGAWIAAMDKLRAALAEPQ